MEKLGSNGSLLGFDNGVYDLEKGIFRDGEPADYVCYSVGYNFPKDVDKETNKGCWKFINDIFNNQDVRDYILKLLATSLSGDVNDQHFYMWTNPSGSNGKSKLKELMIRTLGNDYSCAFDITLITSKRGHANAANSAIASNMLRRLGFFVEPDKDDKINVGLMKEMTGGHQMTTRQLFGQQVQFKPKFKLHLLCNLLPDIPSTEGGTWRRIRAIEFKNRFVQNPILPNEKKMIDNIDENFDKWKYAFMMILLDYFNKYMKEGLNEPEEILNKTEQYKLQNDHSKEFFVDRIEKSDDEKDYITLTQIRNEYCAWCEENGIKERLQLKILKQKIIEFTGCTFEHQKKINNKLEKNVILKYRFKEEEKEEYKFSNEEETEEVVNNYI